MIDQNYDLVVIGSGPAGQKGAINAAKLGKRVVVIERAGMVGGTSVHSGTVQVRPCGTPFFISQASMKGRSTDKTILYASESTGTRSPVVCR